MSGMDMTVPPAVRRRRRDGGMSRMVVVSLVVSLLLHGLLLLSLGNMKIDAPVTVRSLATAAEEVSDWFTLLPLDESEPERRVADGEGGRASEHERRSRVTDRQLETQAISLDDIPQPPSQEPTPSVRPEELRITAEELDTTMVKSVTLAGVDTGATPGKLPDISVTPEELPDVELPEPDLGAVTLPETQPGQVKVEETAVALPQDVSATDVSRLMASALSAPVTLPSETPGSWQVSYVEASVTRRGGGDASGVPQLTEESLGATARAVREQTSDGQAGRGAAVGGRPGHGGPRRARIPIRIRLGAAPDVAAPDGEGDEASEEFTLLPPSLRDDRELLERARRTEGGLPFEKSVPLDEFVQVSVRIQRDEDGGGYYQVLVGANVRSDALPDVAKDVLFVIDHPGSIQGTRLSQFKAMTRQALGQLNAADRFNVVSFTSRARPLFENFVAPTPENIALAQRRIQGLVSSGTTDVFGGVGPFVKRGNGDLERPVIVFLLTDGQSTIARHRGEIQVDNENTSEVLRTIATLNPGNVSIYPFSAGRNADRVLLDFMARLNRGMPCHAPNGDSFRSELGTYLRTHLSLLVRNFRYIAEGGLSEGLYPRSLPHLYRNEALAIYGRFRPEDDALVLTLLGYDADGRMRNLSFKRRFADCEEMAQDALEGGVSLKEQWMAQKTLHLLAEWVVSATGKTGPMSPERRSRRAELNRLLASMTAFTKYSNLLQ